MNKKIENLRHLLENAISDMSLEEIETLEDELGCQWFELTGTAKAKLTSNYLQKAEGKFFKRFDSPDMYEYCHFEKVTLDKYGEISVTAQTVLRDSSQIRIGYHHYPYHSLPFNKYVEITPEEFYKAMDDACQTIKDHKRLW